MQLKMKAPQAVLTLPDGTAVDVERIGRGRYTVAWRNSHHVYLQVSDKDSSKEILSNLSPNKHLPACKFLASHPYKDFKWYQMPLYQALTAKHKRAWEDFKLLKELREQAVNQMPWNQRTRASASEINAAFDDSVQDATYLSEELKEAVSVLVNAAANYGEYLTEITKKNCAVDDAGNLILLDPLFDWAEVKAAREAAMRKHRGY